MKKNIKLIICIIVVVVLIGIIFIINNNESNGNDKLKATQIAFTINDNGTEIEVMVKNPNNKNVNISGLQAKLYGQNNNLITTLNLNEKKIIKKDSKKVFMITSQKQYLDVYDTKIKVIY